VDRQLADGASRLKVDRQYTLQPAFIASEFVDLRAPLTSISFALNVLTFNALPEQLRSVNGPDCGAYGWSRLWAAGGVVTAGPEEGAPPVVGGAEEGGVGAVTGSVTQLPMYTKASPFLMTLVMHGSRKRIFPPIASGNDHQVLNGAQLDKPCCAFASQRKRFAVSHLARSTCPAGVTIHGRPSMLTATLVH
jgi:hypothetical protein